MESLMAKNRPSLKSPRSKAFNLQNGRCYYCRYPVWNDSPENFASLYGLSRRNLSKFRCTGEHLQSHAEGGSASQENIVAACAFCNMQRHRRKNPNPEKFRELVAHRVQRCRWHTQLFPFYVGVRDLVL